MIKNLAKYKGTYLLILVNIVSYCFQSSEQTISSLLVDGANFAPFSLSSQPHRLLTSIFLHGNLLHLSINIYSLYILGQSLEPRIGIVRYFHLYLFSGVIGALMSCKFNLFSISIGASGAILGIYAFNFLDEWNRTKTEKRFIIINFLVFLILTISLSYYVNTDHYAHLGGLFAGIITFFLFKYSSSTAIVSTTWLLPMVLYYTASPIQKTYFDAYQYMIQKDGHISSALNSSYLNSDEQAEKIHVIQTLPDSIQLKFSGIKNLPTELQLDTAIIYEFFNYRKQQIAYALKLLENDSFLYQDSILYINEILSHSRRPYYALGFNTNQANRSEVNINSGLIREREYYDENWDPTPHVYKAKYYRIGTKDSTGRWHGKIIDYYADDTPQMKGTYSRDLKQGVFIYYNDDGTISSAGCYHKDQEVGKWEYYYTGNRLQSEIKYIDNYSYLITKLDTLGKYLIKDGKGVDLEYHVNGNLAYKRTVEGGLNHGIYEGYYENGDPFFIEYHKSGFLDYGISYDTLGNVYRYEEFIEWPYPIGGFEDLITYFESNNTMKSDEFEDYVELKFRVRKNGTLHDIIVTRSLTPELDDYTKDLLLNGPKWHPAKLRGFEVVERASFVRVMY